MISKEKLITAVLLRITKTEVHHCTELLASTKNEVMHPFCCHIHRASLRSKHIETYWYVRINVENCNK